MRLRLGIGGRKWATSAIPQCSVSTWQRISALENWDLAESIRYLTVCLCAYACDFSFLK
jgi:hypothetical protein